MTIGTILRHFLLLSEFEYFFFSVTIFFGKISKPEKMLPNLSKCASKLKKRQKQKKDAKVISSLSKPPISI